MKIWKNYVTIKEIAKLTNRSARTIETWNLPAPDYEKKGESRRWLKSRIQEWLKLVQDGLLPLTKKTVIRRKNAKC